MEKSSIEIRDKIMVVVNTDNDGSPGIVRKKRIKRGVLEFQIQHTTGRKCLFWWPAEYVDFVSRKVKNSPE